MIIVTSLIVFIIGILLSITSVIQMLFSKTTPQRIGGFIGGILYLFVIYLSAYDIFIR